MSLKLNNPIAVFDLETTGLDIAYDRIVEIAIIRINTDQTTQTYSKRVNPQIPISKESSSLHGIYDEDVKNEPTFDEIASEIALFLENCDLAGYNSNKFDIPLLAEEFIRAKSSFDITKCQKVDVQNIFHKMEQRTLAAAYQFYCNKTLNDAHNALADAQATWEILQAQLKKYDNLERNVDFLAEFTKNNNINLLDFAGRIALNEKKEAIYNFGKHKGKTIKAVNKEEPGYYGWMMNANFPLYTKQVLKQEMDKIRIREKENKNKNKQLKEQKKKSEEHLFQEKLNALQNKFK